MTSAKAGSYSPGPSNGLRTYEAGTINLAPRSGAIVGGVEWKEVQERRLDDGGPTNPFELLPPEFSGFPIIEHLRGVADRFPHKICVHDGTQQLTFSELYARVREVYAGGRDWFRRWTKPLLVRE